jgi:CRP-like cAMP-binding protein
MTVIKLKNWITNLGGIKMVEKQLHAGQMFGEIAILYNCPRSATIKSRTRMLLWVIKAIRIRNHQTNKEVF